MKENRTLSRLRVQWRIGELTLPEAFAVAADVVDEGVAAPSMQRLADGDVVSAEEIEFLLDAAAAEASLPNDIHVDVRSFAREVALQIVNGSVTPYAGARRIWEAALLLDDDHTYDAFKYAASEYEDRPEDARFFEDAILNEAKRMTADNQ